MTPIWKKTVQVDRSKHTVSATFSVYGEAPDIQGWADRIERAVEKANRFCEEQWKARQQGPDAAREAICKLNRERYGGQAE